MTRCKAVHTWSGKEQRKYSNAKLQLLKRVDGKMKVLVRLSLTSPFTLPSSDCQTCLVELSKLMGIRREAGRLKTT